MKIGAKIKLFVEKHHRWLLCLAIAAAILIVFQTSRKMIKSEFAKGDMEAFLHAAQLLIRGENIYQTPSRDLTQGGVYYLYLPLLAILFVPLALLPVNFSIVLWNVFNVFLVFWIVRTFYETMTGERFADLSNAQFWTICFLPILLTLRFILHHLSYGQANLLVLACLIGALKLMRNRRDLSGGALIGTALILKMIAVPFVFWIVAERKIKTMIGIALGILLGAFVVPAVFLGVSQNFDYFIFWLDNAIVRESLSTARVPLGVNVSLQAQLQRFFTPVHAFEFRGNSVSLMIFELSPTTIRVLAKIIQAAVLGAIFFYAVKFRALPEIVSRWGGAALTFALIPLFAPTTQKHYFVMLLPAYVFVIYWWSFRHMTDKIFRGLVVASFVCLSLTVDGLVGKTLDDFFTAAGFLAWGTMLLVGAIFRVGFVCRQSNLKPPN